MQFAQQVLSIYPPFRLVLISFRMAMAISLKAPGYGMYFLASRITSSDKPCFLSRWTLSAQNSSFFESFIFHKRTRLSLDELIFLEFCQNVMLPNPTYCIFLILLKLVSSSRFLDYINICHLKQSIADHKLEPQLRELIIHLLC